ncbi:tetratricopeptide (TPR) repeat protein [Kitasatospora sp. GP30]|nr:tetratricopeptide (TPR) repeat protein [Kitasatospora sp. GP30]
MGPLTIDIMRQALARVGPAERSRLGWIIGVVAQSVDQGDELAELAVRQAAADARTAQAVWVWLEASAGVRVENAISGSAQVSGNVLQVGEVRGDVHLHAPAASTIPVPRQLPLPPAQFTGRLAELDALDQLGAESRVLVVNGPAGVGKTALLLSWLHGRTERFPDGQLHADLRGHGPEGPASALATLGGLLRAFGVDRIPGEADEAAALWRSVTAGRRILLMLDNALTAAQVRPLLPGTADAAVVVASRNRLTGLGVDGAAFLSVGLLDEVAAAGLLVRRIGDRRAQAEPAAVGQVVARCAGLALAVSLVAARLAARPQLTVAAVVAALDRENGRLAALRLDGEPAVQSALDASCACLAAAPARLYRRLGLLPFGEFGADDAAALIDEPPLVAEELLDSLAEANLVEELGADRYRFHDLVRLHAALLARTEESDADVEAALGRVVEWYLATARTAERLLTPSHAGQREDNRRQHQGLPFAPDDQAAALAWLDQKRTQLAAAVRTAVGQHWDRPAWQLVDAMHPLFLRLRAPELGDELHRLGLAAARRDGNPAAVARMLTDGARRLDNLGKPEESGAWYQQAYELARTGGGLKEQAQALHGLGRSHRSAGRLTEAQECFQEALRLREAVGYQRGAELTRLLLAEVAMARGRPESAVPELESAHRSLMSLGDPYEAARALAFLGQARTALGRFDAAAQALEEAAGLFRAAGSAYWEARVLELSGQLAEARDTPEQALACYRESLARYQQVGAADRDRLSEAVRRLAAPEG